MNVDRESYENGISVEGEGSIQKCGANAILAEQRAYLDHPRVAAWPIQKEVQKQGGKYDTNSQNCIQLMT